MCVIENYENRDKEIFRMYAGANFFFRYYNLNIQTYCTFIHNVIDKILSFEVQDVL